MAVRQIEPIDRAELRATVQKWIDAHTDVDDTDGVGLLEDVLWEINAQPTLTPPNEWLSKEQLWEMNNVPIWVVDTSFNRSEWCYWKDGYAYSCESPPEYYDSDDYGKWLAYSRPPEGEA